MDIRPFVERIVREFPQFAGKEPLVPPQGMDHLAIVMDKEWIFRFPNRKEYHDSFPKEVALLDFLHQRLSLPIPHYELIAKDSSFGGYRMIQGVLFAREIFPSLPKEVRHSIAAQLAEFLSQLHTIPRADLKPFHLKTHDLEADVVTMEADYAKYVEPIITPEERKACEKTLRRRRELLHAAPHSVFTHSDLYFEHIFLKKDHSGLAGIIDFGDVCMNDPAIDFREWWDFGYEFLQEIYDLYTGPKDAGFLERSLIFYKRVGIQAIVYAAKGEFRTIESERPFFERSLTIGKELF